MIDAESAVLASHSDDLVNDVESVLWNCGSRVLLTYYFAHLFEFRIFDLKGRLHWCMPKFRVLLLLEVLLHVLFTLHQAVIVFLDNLMGIGMRCTLWPSAVATWWCRSGWLCRSLSCIQIQGQVRCPIRVSTIHNANLNFY